jgi:hypothetical protein
MLGVNRLRLVVGSCALGILVASSSASAQPTTDEDRAAARSAATAGAAALQESRFDEAADLFARAESLMHAPTHLLYLARAQVKLGRLVKARENYLKITRETLAAGSPKAFTDAQAAATVEVADLEGRIPTIKVSVEGEGAESATVTMDGQKMAAALTGVPFPIDPGEHKFQARTKDLTSETVTVTCAEGTRQTLTVSLKLSLRTDGAPPPPAASVVAPAPVGKDAAGGTPPPQKDKGGLRTGAYVALGVGAVGLVGGTIFLLGNRSNRNDANALCSSGCPESKRGQITDLDNTASTDATLAVVGYLVGVAGAGAGVALWIMSSKASGGEAPKAARLRPVLAGTPHAGYAGLGGAF